MELDSFLDVAKDAAWRAAGVLESWRKRFQVAEKGRADLVTDADLASQKLIREVLLGAFPTHAFLGEEDRLEEKPPFDSPPLWIVDPIDGTTNYVHDVPFYCISIGLMMEGNIVLGVVLDPCRKELFTARRGGGAWLNENRLGTSNFAELSQCLIATGFPANMTGKSHLLDWWRKLGLECQGLRRTGSTALNLAYVAAGRFDACYGSDNHVWDVAGGIALVSEAGGMLSRLGGELLDPFLPDILATNGTIHSALTNFFKSNYDPL